MTMREILVRNFNSTNPDPVLDLKGCRKRGMVDAIFDSPHIWGSQEGLPKFVVIKCDLTDTDLSTYDSFRMEWRDNIDYEITSTNPAQGIFSVRIFETNTGANSQNSITGVKSNKIQGYLIRWGCTSIVVSSNEISFNIALWDAIRSMEFWDIDAIQLAYVSFVLNSYASQTGIADITINHNESFQFNVARKIIERGGMVCSSTTTKTQFTIERSELLQNFKQDIKQKAEDIYMYQRFRFGNAFIDRAVSAGGIIEVTRSELLSAIIDAMA